MSGWRDCPEWIVALLEHIEAEMERLYWNKYQEEYESPFRNTGARFDNGVFSVRAFNWGDEDDDEDDDEPNFVCGPMRVRWYKHLGRCTEIDQLPDADTVITYFTKCMSSLEQAGEWQEEWDERTN